jgi:hypothetical protein
VLGIADLKGLVIGVREGNTSESIAEKLVAEGAADQIERALDDLSTSGCDAFMKLARVTRWFVRDRPQLKVAEAGITRERLASACARGIAH